jgi:hypothetical protein
MALGWHYDEEALQDFDLDVTHHTPVLADDGKDSLMGIAITNKVLN